MYKTTDACSLYTASVVGETCPPCSWVACSIFSLPGGTTVRFSRSHLLSTMNVNFSANRASWKKAVSVRTLQCAFSWSLLVMRCIQTWLLQRRGAHWRHMENSNSLSDFSFWLASCACFSCESQKHISWREKRTVTNAFSNIALRTFKSGDVQNVFRGSGLCHWVCKAWEWFVYARCEKWKDS